MSAQLLTCPICQQPGFSARGLKSHEGNKTCKARAATLQLSIDADAPQALTPAQVADLKAQMAAGANRFRVLHGMLKLSAVQFRLIKFLTGLEANLLSDLHRELYGETRGGGVAKDVPLMGTWVEEHLGITESTWRKMKAFFQGIISAHPDLAKKLIKGWETWKLAKIKAPAKPKALKPGAKPVKKKAQITAHPGAQIMAGVTLTEADFEELLLATDEWGIHELFEKPQRDVTPPPADPPPSGDGDGSIKFWLQDFQRRALNNEFLKLPKDKREALLTTTQEMVQKLSDSLKKKTA